MSQTTHGTADGGRGCIPGSSKNPMVTPEVEWKGKDQVGQGFAKKT